MFKRINDQHGILFILIIDKNTLKIFKGTNNYLTFSLNTTIKPLYF